MQPILHVHLLGSPHILVGNSRAADFPTEKVRLLFFYLLLFRSVQHPRPVLASLFWGNSPELQARRSLNTAVWRLCQWLKSHKTHPAVFLLINSQQIGFISSSKCWLDVEEFEKRITWARQMSPPIAQKIVALEGMVDLYRGDLLEGCYEEWCLAERERLRELFLEALALLMACHRGRREYGQAISYARRIVEDDPLREEIHLELMKLYVLNGQPAEAIQHYRHYEQLLRKELGVQPMSASQALFYELMLQSNLSGLGDLHPGASDQGREKGQALSAPDQVTTALDRFEVAKQELISAIKVFQQQRNEIR